MNFIIALLHSILFSMILPITNIDNFGKNMKINKTCIISKSKDNFTNLENISFSVIKQFKVYHELFFLKYKIVCAEYEYKEGWNILNIKTFRRFSNEIQSYFAGYIEGFIYFELIGYHHKNIFETIFNRKNLPDSLNLYLKTQKNFLKRLVDSNHNDQNYEYIKLLKYLLLQLDGLKKGQRDSANKEGKIPLSDDEIDHIVYQADLNDLLPAFNFTQTESNESKFLHKECSGYVRFNNITKNLITSHTTHNLYSLMNRVYKFYDFEFDLEGIKMNNFKFSSRPGDLNSKDDFYIISNGMSVIETSLEIFNKTLFKNLSPLTVPKWIRINIANRLAKNNLDWIEIFFKFNSGTHNDQWLLVDYNEFDTFLEKEKIKKENKPSKIIHLVEQIPVLEKAYFEDLSETLIKDGYVATYNAPYFKETIELSGYKNTTHPDYFNANRYFLFKKLGKNADSVESIKKLMEYHDKENMCDTIAPRCDLIENFAFGSVDGKITDKEMIRNMQSEIKNGPPFIEGISTPFNFSSYKNISHLGMPEYFDFKWIRS